MVSDNETRRKDGLEFSGTEGIVTVGGEFFVGFDKEHIFKYEILKRILEVGKLYLSLFGVYCFVGSLDGGLFI